MNGNANEQISLYIESPDGEQFECEISAATKLSRLAADFFEARGWPTSDSRGRNQRAVVELIDPENPDRTKRLRGEQSVDDAGLWDGAILRIFPESIAGRIDPRARVRALVADHQDMRELASWHPFISFTANMDHAPFEYTVTFSCQSFVGLSDDGDRPLIDDEHQARITLGAKYPRRAPRVRWLTAIFHPNIDPDSGAVCLGVLMDRYLPGMGLARIVLMLAEMLQWRNFDLRGVLNAEAAEWASDLERHWQYIRQIEGYPFQKPVHELQAEFEKQWQGQGKRERIEFSRVA
jgi:ubiquitin-protein ligase